MHPIQVTTTSTPRTQWLAARRAGIGASDIAMALNLSPYGSPFSLYWDKVAPGDDQDNDLAATGRHLEPSIAAWWAGQNTDHHISITGMWRSYDRPWQLATPDRLVYPACSTCRGTGEVTVPAVGEEVDGTYVCMVCASAGFNRDAPPVAVLECKWTAFSWDGWGEEGTNEIPIHYACQVQWQMDVMGVDTAYVAALGPGGFRSYTVHRDEADIQVLREYGRAFWERVETGDAPDIDDAHPATTEAIKRLHPDLTDETIQIDIELAEAWRRAKALTKRSDLVAKRLENRVRATMGNARRAECNGHLVASRSITVTTTDLAELDSLDTDPATTDKLTPGRTTNYRELHSKRRS